MSFIKIFSLNFSGLSTSCWNKSLYWAATKDENILASIVIRNNNTHVYDLGERQHNSNAEVTRNILKYQCRFRSQIPMDLCCHFLILWLSSIVFTSTNVLISLLWWFISYHHLSKVSISQLSLTLRPSFILTQFLTNRGSFRSYLHKINKRPSPICGCPEKAVQKARHLMTECSLFSSERPAVLRNLPPPLVLKHHINTVGITSFLRNIFHTLQEQSKCNQIV